MQFHPTVARYRKCPPGKGYRKLTNIDEYKSVLTQPTDFRSEIGRTVNNAQAVLSQVLDAVENLEHETVRLELKVAFEEFFGKPFDNEKWKRVHGTLSLVPSTHMLTIDQQNSSAWAHLPKILTLSIS